MNIPKREHVPPLWWDMFAFTDEPVIECPDCGAQSLPCRDVRAAVMWVMEHSLRCPA